MNTEELMRTIETELFVFQKRIIFNASLNRLDLNIDAEEFYRLLFNIIFDYHLENLNIIEPNAAAIDLIDRDAKVVIQVTSTASKEKIEKTLKNEAIDKYKNYRLKFMFIGNEVSSALRKKIFNNQYNIHFYAHEDLYDITVLLKHIRSLEIEKKEEVYDCIKNTCIYILKQE